MTAQRYRKARGKRKKKHFQKPNTTCNSHSAIISAQRCSSKILSETASSSLLLTQDSPDIPADLSFPECPTDRAQEQEVCPARRCCCSHQPGASCATPAVRPQELQAAAAISGSPSPALPGGLWAGWCHSCTLCWWHVDRRWPWVIHKLIPSSERSIRH